MNGLNEVETDAVKSGSQRQAVTPVCSLWEVDDEDLLKLKDASLSIRALYMVVDRQKDLRRASHS